MLTTVLLDCSLGPGRPRGLCSSRFPISVRRRLEQLVSYDSTIVVGILGGSAGTTFDAFQMLWEAKKYGAHAALFGRKINTADHQLSFVTYLRRLADGEIEPAEAVRAYHADLEKLKIRPSRSLADDMCRQQRPDRGYPTPLSSTQSSGRNYRIAFPARIGSTFPGHAPKY